MARLSPKRKQNIRQKAKAQSRRENVSSGSIAQSQIAGANRDYGREAQSARGAQKVEVSQLNNMLSNVRDSGLRGKYAAQTVNELRARKMDSISGLPYALADANTARRDAISTARSDLLASQVAQQEAFGSTFNDLLGDARDAKQGRIDDRKEARADGGMDAGVKSALIVANTYLKAANPKERAELLKDPGGFILGVAQEAEGADQVDAKRAVQILLERINKPVGSAAWAQEKKKRTG